MMRMRQKTNLSGREVQSVAKPLRIHCEHRVHFSLFAFHLVEIETQAWRGTVRKGGLLIIYQRKDKRRNVSVASSAKHMLT